MRSPVIDPEQSAMTMKCRGRRATPPPGMTGNPSAGSGVIATDHLLNGSLVERAGMVLPPGVDGLHGGLLAADRLKDGVLRRGRPDVGRLEDSTGPAVGHGEALELLAGRRPVELAAPAREPVGVDVLCRAAAR